MPDSFWWGTAASSPQAEGAAPASDWLAWERAGRVPRSGEGNGFATRFADDLRLYASFGLRHHRLGIEWARIEPEEGRRDPAAVAHYRLILEAAREAGISAWVCLHHFVLPAWVASKGMGFRDERARSYYWRRHLEFIAETYGDLVVGWKPINEPTAYALEAFAGGDLPPGVNDPSAAMEAIEGVHLAGLTAWTVLRQTGKPVATIHNLSPIYPADDTPEAAEAARREDEIRWTVWIRAIREGLLQVPGRAPIEVPEYRDAFDLIGFSYYHALAVNGRGETLPYPADGKVGPMGYVPWSPGLGLVLDRLASELPGKPLVICELGIGTKDDAWRSAYLAACLAIVAERLARGTDIHGLFHWTGVDNYEWAKGFTVQFGLFDLDRQPRGSAALLRDIAATGVVPSRA
ncbi:MAG: family 1 glycosylhydrolase [Chloroflexota bacterium]|nr:family 1 glycosylhydrolase [Chloroflexota bacterium]